jgi:hypothetical protein
VNTLQNSGTPVSSQPGELEVRGELDTLINQLASTGSDATRTRTIAKAACASVLGSAAILLQ